VEADDDFILDDEGRRVLDTSFCGKRLDLLIRLLTKPQTHSPLLFAAPVVTPRTTR
jgi:hypothetical protein